jgi:hypothetical protein
MNFIVAGAPARPAIEDAAHVEVHHLVPGLEGVVLGGCAPGGAGVVDEDVDLAEPLHRLVRDALDLFGLARVGGDPARVDALVLQVRGGFLEVACLARGQQDLGAGFAQRLGDLQPEAARAAGDQRRLAGQVEQCLDRCAHVGLSDVSWSSTWRVSRNGPSWALTALWCG